MKKVAGLDTKLMERASLQRAWWFASFTSLLVTFTGLIYGGAALYIAIWTNESLSKKGIEVETLLSL